MAERTDQIAEIRPEGSERAIPEGWVAEPLRWDGREAEIAFDPRRFKVGRFTSSGLDREHRRRLFTQAGWRRAGVDAEGAELWIGDRDHLDLTRPRRQGARERPVPEYVMESSDGDFKFSIRVKAELPFPPGAEVRWKQGGRWRYGRLADPPLERDGSLHVRDNYNGGSRSLRPDGLQVMTRGPRGGRRWTPVEEGIAGRSPNSTQRDDSVSPDVGRVINATDRARAAPPARLSAARRAVSSPALGL